MKYIQAVLLFSIIVNGKLSAQSCNCEQEFLYIKNVMEQNYAGFSDKLAQITKAVYEKKTKQWLSIAKGRQSTEKCVLVIADYINLFKDEHVSFTFRDNTGKVTLDSAVMDNKEIISLTPQKLKQLRLSKGIEGVYYFRHDSSYKVAVIKSPTAVRDYVGIMIDSKYPQWKKGMVKFEMKKYNKDAMKGVLYLRSHMAKPEWFYISKDGIGGDWRREGSDGESKTAEPWVPVASKLLTAKTLYIKISSFDAGNARHIDSVIKENKSILDTIPNLVLDLRNNGGGADFAYGPLLPYIYTNPVKGIGVDVISTDQNIQAWKNILTMEGLPEETINNLKGMIAKMEVNKGKLVSIVDDEIDSSFTRLPHPERIIVLINSGCASTTEQFLLAALQSKKVQLMGENTGGVLDYANVREKDFKCLPYTLHYATTRSRRVDIGQGIDNVGIKPQIVAHTNDWIKEALKILEP